MNKFELFSELKKIPRSEKKVDKKIKKTYVRFVISNSFLQFSYDLWKECFDGMESIGLATIDKDDKGNSVDWLFIKGYKEKVTLKNNKDLHKVHTRKGSGRKYLNLNSETFDRLNKKLNSKRGGVKSRAYGIPNFPERYKSPNENLIIVDHKDRKNWKNSSIDRVKKTDNKDKSKANTT